MSLASTAVYSIQVYEQHNQCNDNSVVITHVRAEIIDIYIDYKYLIAYTYVQQVIYKINRERFQKRKRVAYFYIKFWNFKGEMSEIGTSKIFYFLE